jgi:hypothetical protein
LGQVKETGELAADQLTQRVEPHRLGRDGAADFARCRVFVRRAGWNFESVGAEGAVSGLRCAAGTTGVRRIATTSAGAPCGWSRSGRRGGLIAHHPKAARNIRKLRTSGERGVESAWRINLPRI